jgi:hypothetical protein
MFRSLTILSVVFLIGRALGHSEARKSATKFLEAQGIDVPGGLPAYRDAKLLKKIATELKRRAGDTEFFDEEKENIRTADFKVR